MALSLQEAVKLFESGNVQDQRMLAQLAQQTQAARTSPMVTSDGVLAPTPVERQRQANELWKLKFPDRAQLTPEARLASGGMTAENQWGLAGGVEGVDPTKLAAMNKYRDDTAASSGAYKRAAVEAGGLGTPAGRQAGMNAISRTYTAEENERFEPAGPVKNSFRGNDYLGSTFSGPEGLAQARQLFGGDKIPANAARAVTDPNGNVVGWSTMPAQAQPAPAAPMAAPATVTAGVGSMMPDMRGTTPRVAPELVQKPNLFGTETNPNPQVLANYEKKNPENILAAPSTPGLNLLGTMVNAPGNAMLGIGRTMRNFFLGQHLKENCMI
jgi:hypothetical protein